MECLSKGRIRLAMLFSHHQCIILGVDANFLTHLFETGNADMLGVKIADLGSACWTVSLPLLCYTFMNKCLMGGECLQKSNSTKNDILICGRHINGLHELNQP